MKAKDVWCAMALCVAVSVSPVVIATATALPPAAKDDGGAEVPFLGGFLMETRIVYPLRVGDWEAAGEKRYDAAEYGASVRYQQVGMPHRWIDIYFYPAGVVPPSHLDEAAMGTLRELETLVGEPGGYVALEPGPLHAFGVPPADGTDDGAIPARSADMYMVLQDGVYNSAMTLLIDRLYYIKGRHSVAAEASGRMQVRRDLEGFVVELVAKTYIGSTGRCWSPAPIDALEAGAAEPADARLAAGSNGGNDAWLVGGRVLARDPGGDAAQALALLAMSVDGRLYPGCVGAEPHNPDVPGSHREIRFEYRAPAEIRRDGGHRPRPLRISLG